MDKTTHIDKVWRTYFTNHNEGIGTTYERFILHQHFERIKNKFSINSVLEVPSFGMTGISGINSLWWENNKIPVTLVDHDKERLDLIRSVWEELSFKANFVYQEEGYLKFAFENNAFDLSWNFASLRMAQDLKQFLGELARVSKKVIFICIPNCSNIFNLLRRVGGIDPLKIKETMRNFNWQIAEEGFMDTPPWPDIAMKKEDLLQKFGLGRRRGREVERRICILDYFSGKNIDMEKEVLRYAFLENTPSFFQSLWAHHRYFIFTPERKII
ncbi:MAG: methyltransferase domain-containing protein [Actinomycetota bacterium]